MKEINIKAIGNFIILFLVIFIYAEKNQDIITEGEGQGKTETEALLNAKYKSVENAIKTFLQSKSEQDAFAIKREQALTEGLEAVKSYEIMLNKKETDGQHKVKIKAVLSYPTIYNELISLKILIKAMKKPKVMVIIQENNLTKKEVYSHAAEDAIIKFLKKSYNFKIIDPAIVASVRTSESKMTILLDDTIGAASIGSTFDAQVIIAGSAFSKIEQDVSKNLQGMKSVEADIYIRAINCATGKVIASIKTQSDKVNISPNAGGRSAIIQASYDAIKQIVVKIIEEWNIQVKKGTLFQVSIKGVNTSRIKNAVIKTFHSIPGVISVNKPKWNDKDQILTASVNYKGNANDFYSKSNGFKLGFGGGSLAIKGRKGAEITYSIQAK